MSRFDVVQHVSAFTNPATVVAGDPLNLVLGSAPTPGNILVLLVNENDGSSSSAISWLGAEIANGAAAFNTASSGFSAVARTRVRVKKALSTDTATTTITIANTGEDLTAVLLELEGPAGQWFAESPNGVSPVTAVTSVAAAAQTMIPHNSHEVGILVAGMYGLSAGALTGIAVDSGYSVVETTQTTPSATASALVVATKKFDPTLPADSGTPAVSWTHSADSANSVVLLIGENNYTGGWSMSPFFNGSSLVADMGPWTGSWPPPFPDPALLPLDAGEIDYIVAVPNPKGDIQQNIDFTYPNVYYLVGTYWSGSPGGATNNFGAGSSHAQDGGVDTGLPAGAHLYITWWDVAYDSNPVIPQPSVSALALYPGAATEGYAYNRMPYSQDGTKLYTVVSGTATLRSGADATLLDNEASDTTSAADRVKDWVWVFPSARHFDAVYVLTDSTAPTQFQVYGSNDTTDGSDGSWAALAAGDLSTGDYTAYHAPLNTSIFPAPVRQQKFRSIKITGIDATDPTAGLMAVHLFGTTVDSYADQLVLWHPTQDQQLSAGKFYAGQLNQGSSAPVQRFRVKNLSRALTAVDVSVGPHSVTAAPTVDQASEQFFRVAGYGPFKSHVQLGALAPRSVSPIIEMKRVTASNADTGAWAAWVLAYPTSWQLRQFRTAHL